MTDTPCRRRAIWSARDAAAAQIEVFPAQVMAPEPVVVAVAWSEPPPPPPLPAKPAAALSRIARKPKKRP